MTDFNFKFRLDYSELVKKRLYDYDRENLDAPDYAFQWKSENRVTCLLCNTEISVPVSIEDLKNHLKSNVHLSSSNIDAFNSYHKIFKKYDEFDQYVQIYFCPRTQNKLYCDTCMLEISDDKVEEHLMMFFHNQINNRYWSPSAFFDGSSKLEEQHFNYLNLIKDDVSPWRLSALAFVNSPLMLQTVGKVNFCLLCNRKDIGSFKEHYEKKAHRSASMNIDSFRIVSKFHDYWMDQPKPVRFYRRYFVPLTFKLVHCVICASKLRYERISKHIGLRCKNLTESSPLLEPELMDVMIPDVRMYYPKDILMTFYPDKLMKDINSNQCVKMFTIQRLLQNTQCLLCQVLLKDIMTTTEILEHIRSNEHQQMIEKVDYTKSLVEYHKFWMRQEHINIQLKQQFFRPYNREMMQCLKCLRTCEFVHIIEHSDKDCQNPEDTSSHISTSSIKNLQIDNGSKKYSQATTSRDSTPGSANEEEFDGRVSSFKSSPAKIKNCDNYCSNSKEEGSIKQADNISSKSIQINMIEQTSGPKTNTNVSLGYSRKIMETVYHYFKSQSKICAPTEFFIQRRSNLKYYCLICKLNITEKLKSHIKCKDHLHNVSNLETWKQLKLYHEFWMKQSADKQKLQVYFNLHTTNKVDCDFCKEYVFLENVFDHACLYIRDIYGYPEGPTKFNLTYHENVTKHFFPRTFRQISKNIVNLETPLCLSIKHKIQCLLCGRISFKGKSFWRRHLLEHSDDMVQVQKKMRYILEYHQFWQSQTYDKQFYLVHFHPIFKGAMKCANHHLVFYTDAFKHINNCPVDITWRNLAEKLSISQTERGSKEQSPVRVMEECVPIDHEENGDGSNESSSEVCEQSMIDDYESDEDKSFSENNTDNENPIEDISECVTTGVETIKPDEVINNCDQASNSMALECNMGEVVKSKVFDGHREIPPKIKEYDNETISTLYPNFNNINRSRRDIIYFLQKRSTIEYYCLLCKISIIGIPIDHIKGKKHIRSYTNPKLQELLELYHDFWMQQPADKQVLQVLFNPDAPNTFICANCKKMVLVTDVFNHTCISRQNEHFEVSEKYRHFEIKYYAKIAKRFFSRTFLDVSKAVFNTEIPMGLHFQSKALCFLCGKRIYRDTAIWYKHLLEHRSNTEQVEERLYYILQYHQFWEQQYCHLQICMVHYVPNFRGAMKCTKQHLVYYEQAFQHLKKCPVEDWKKLVRLSGEDAPSQLTSVEHSPIRVKQESTSIEESNGDDCDGANNGNNSLRIGDIMEPTNSKSDAEFGKTVKSQVMEKKTEICFTPFERDLMVEINKIANSEPRSKQQKRKHNIIPSVDKRESDNILDMLPNRFKCEIVNLSINEQIINCKLCNISCGSTVSSVMFHCITIKHLNLTKYPHKRSHFCNVCQSKFNNEKKWLSHMDSEFHKLSCERHFKLSNTPLKEYECLTCNYVIYADQKSALIHQEQKKTKRIRPVILNHEVRDLFKNESTTEKIALDSLDTILKNEKKDEELVINCIKGFEDALRQIYPNCKAYPFGSRMTGIGNSNSDLDVFIDIGDMYFNSTNQKEQPDIVLKVKKILLENRKNFSDICAITNARTPIIRVIHNSTNIDCDLSFRHGLSVENTKFISFCFDLQPIARLAMLTLKRWADIINLKEEITSYALCMMFIFYMQVKGYLISVHKLRELNNTDVRTIDGWEVISYTKPLEELVEHVKKYEGSVFKLLQGFVKFYSEFDFAREVVCPLLGSAALIKDFENRGCTLPKEMETLTKRMKSDPECVFKISAMCVQDPFDLAHNLTKAIFKSYREKYMMLCQLTYEHMISP